jgi:hypothetical protein
LQDALKANEPRTTWTKEEIANVYNTPLIELQYAAVSAPLFYTPIITIQNTPMGDVELPIANLLVL